MNTERRPSGLIAILRGLTPAEAVDTGLALAEEGFRALEVPLNSPRPLESIALLREALPTDVRVGAGTVLTTGQVQQVRAAGADLVVAPNTDTAVIGQALDAGMEPYPGVATPTEALAAVGAGARALKLFPATQVGAQNMRAWRAVLPPHVELLPVGGVDAHDLRSWVEAGATGAGVGSALYRPGVDTAHLRATAREFARAWEQASGSLRTLTDPG